LRLSQLHINLLSIFLLVIANLQLHAQTDITKKNSQRAKLNSKQGQTTKNYLEKESVYKKYNNQGSRLDTKTEQKKIDILNSKKASKSKEIQTTKIDYGLAIQSNSYSPSASQIVNGKKNPHTKEKIKGLSQEIKNSTGDLDQKEKYGASKANTSLVKPTKLPNKAQLNKAAKELASSSGDLEQKEKYKTDGSTKSLVRPVKTANKNKLKRDVIELSKSQGDLAPKEKITSLNQTKSLTNNAKAMFIEKEQLKQRTIEATLSRGDLATKEKLKTSLYGGFAGKHNRDILEETKNKRKALNEKIYYLRGEIATLSLANKKAKMRDQMHEKTYFRGDKEIRTTTKSDHPSALYAGGRIKKSIADKEKYRKRMVRKFRKNKGKEDPIYMRQETMQPQYDIKEYQIWDLKSR
jgi:hypothetical protein